MPRLVLSYCLAAVLLALMLFSHPVQARKNSPLVDEDVNRKNLRSGASRPSNPFLLMHETTDLDHVESGFEGLKSSECLFGRQIWELGATWYADLGPPFGVMYCIVCECVSIHKKRRVAARAQCRNIKNDCPKPSCDEPVLHPNRCCKTCPGDVYSTDVPQDISQPAPTEEEERSMKHFAVLLTGRTAMQHKREGFYMPPDNNPLNVVATGRFNFHKRNLYYSFYVSEKGTRPNALRFIDHGGNILEEHILSHTSDLHSQYQNATGKVCGVWRRVPREYRRMLKDEQLYVSLLWVKEFTLHGKIARYTALGTELFSSLLEAAPGTNAVEMAGAGGTAIVSTSSGATPSIHLTLLFNGVFESDDISEAPISIRLEVVERNLVILDEFKRVTKPSSELNVIEVSSPVSPGDLRLLTRGKLALTIESKHKPESLRLQGNVITRATCEIFQTTLNSVERPGTTPTSGLAWVYLNRDGSLVYNVQVDELDNTKSPMVTLVHDSGKRLTELEDLTPSLINGVAEGTVDKLGPRVLEPLYAGDLAVNIANTKDESLLRGRLIARPVADARDTAAPILLKRLNLTLPAAQVGLAWLSVDFECTLHYEVSISGLGQQHRPMTLHLEQLPFIAPGAPVTRNFLDEFATANFEGSFNELSPIDLNQLETGVSYLEVRSKKNETILKAKIGKMFVPTVCAYPLHMIDNIVPANGAYGNLNSLQLPAGTIIADPGQSCYHSGKFHKEGAQWRSTVDTCTMCSCLYGRVKCDEIKCPEPKCKPEEIEQRDGECCPSCSHSNSSRETNSSTTRGCYLGEQFFAAGTSWHPYLPPNGFDTCAVCTCNYIIGEVKCTRKACPPLACDEKTAYRPDKKACCKVCPEVKPNPSNNTELDVLRDEEPTIANKSIQILSEGGCHNNMNNTTPYENGQEWHPWLASHGEQKCIKCRCKDGNIKCDRVKCPRLACNNHGARRNKLQNRAEQIKEQPECCQCRRYRRHHHKMNSAAAAANKS